MLLYWGTLAGPVLLPAGRDLASRAYADMSGILLAPNATMHIYRGHLFKLLDGCREGRGIIEVC
jgi:hypothetical protein